MRLFHQFFAAVRRWNQRRLAIRELMALPDWALKDIGVMRGEIPRIVDESLDAAASTHATATAAIPAAEHAPEAPEKAAATA